jgi:hypothetical protein
MKRTMIDLLAAALMLAALAGCSLRRPVAHHAVAYNLAVEEAHNRTALLNVVRSMKRQPQHYTAITQVLGTASNSLTPSLSLDLESGTATPWTPSGSATRSGQAVVTVSVLDDQDFVQGLLSPITLEQIDFFLSLGWPENLVGLLFVRRLDVRNDDGFKHPYCARDARKTDASDSSISIYFNQPDESLEDPFKLVKCFGARLKHLRDEEGLKIESQEKKSVDVALETSDQDKLAELILKADQAGLEIEKAVSPGGDTESISYRVVKKKRVKALTWSGGGKAYVDEPEQIEAFKRTRDEETKTKQISVLLYLRSAESVVYYLGEIMRAQAAAGFSTETPFADLEPKVASGNETAVLFAAWKQGPRDDHPLISVEHGGETYVVPRLPNCKDGQVDHCHRSMQVLAIVKQLIGLNKERDSLSTTAVVTTVGGG